MKGSGEWAETSSLLTFTITPRRRAEAGYYEPFRTSAEAASFLIAPSGQTRTQAPQSIHMIVMDALPSPISMASVGQTSAHDAHPVHLSVVTRYCI
jgi:hypothetical protein